MDISVDNINALLKMKINFIKLDVLKFDIKSEGTTEAHRCINNLFLITSGRFIYSQPDIENFCEASTNDIIWLPYESKYEAVYKKDKVSGSGICLDFLIIDEYGNRIIPPEKIIRITSDTDGFYRKLYESAIQKQMNTQCDFAFRSIIYNIFSYLFKDINRFSNRDCTYNEIIFAIHSIECHPQNNVSIKQLAEKCGISETSLRSKFKLYTGGMNPIDYRNYLRVNKSKELLSETACSVEAIAESLGFYDSPYFIKVFKRITCKTPNEYRNEFTKE
jgi:AraC-like DNA-binding protein